MTTSEIKAKLQEALIQSPMGSKQLLRQCFRKVADRRAGMSVLTEMLRTGEARQGLSGLISLRLRQRKLPTIDFAAPEVKSAQRELMQHLDTMID